MTDVRAISPRIFSSFFAAAAIGIAWPGYPADYSPAQSRKIAYDYAICVVHRNHKSAAEAILSNTGIYAITTRYPELIISDCMSEAGNGAGGFMGGGIEARFGGDSYRYALADALVNADFRDFGPTSFEDRLPLAHLLAPTQADLDVALAKTKSRRKQQEMRERFSKQRAVVALSRYGECIVRQDPVAARYWILTKPEVPEEMSRINALRPAFASCLAAGTMKFSKDILRGAVAINYYRLAMATRLPVTGSSK